MTAPYLIPFYTFQLSRFEYDQNVCHGMLCDALLSNVQPATALRTFSYVHQPALDSCWTLAASSELPDRPDDMA